MPALASIFASLRAQNRKALMPFICGGHPAPGSTAALLPALERAGASIVEVGFPFSDPIADGPIIAAAMHDAIARGVTPASVFEETAGARAKTQVGIVAMVTVSIVHRRGGPEKFAAAAKAAGVDGLIVPDAPLEESEELMKAAAAADLAYTHLIAPTTPPRRVEQIAKACTGFIYLLARTGITGEQSSTPQIGPAVQRLRQCTDLPIAVGFGISTPQHVRAVVEHADAAIVGSALVRRMTAAAKEGRDPVTEAETFTRELASGLE